MIKVSLQSVVGAGYRDFWNYTGRYRVAKGGRASKKSTTAAMNFIYRMMKYPDSNLLVIRKVYKDHKDSTYTQLKWAINRLQVGHLWECRLSPLEIRYKPTGQKILFRGLDDPMSITSITVDVGYLCWAWFEEAFQILNEDDFNKVDMSIRGDTGGLFKQITLTFNPWSDKHWLKKRFFDVESSNIMAITTNYLCNEFLDASDLALFEDMRVRFPRRYKIEGLGEWGIAEGGVFENWKEIHFDKWEISKREGVRSAFGLDFGFTNDPTALSCSLIDLKNRELFLFDEHYEKAMHNDEIADMIKRKGYAKELIIADSQEQKSISELRRYGIRRVKAAEKGPDSIRAGIQYLQQFVIYVHPSCTNFGIELSNYVWDTNKEGQLINKPIDDYNHLIDALRYSMEPIRKRDRGR
ncbi:PBSX family phage terminase large subunit [Aneurinibacillus migulanus]|uniref:PBSX family phage terminase large subunit n=1 Tax=Aneurinibacillus migulanus TaxID=47500 RepID=UPI00209F9DA9|nr:PBSX family phage terminase large subunit [Aneurinibacillus migulanus]MCP1355079.1 PBSX family phage terminase large subunit [Aneurinibacillus migulanus]